jgi:hypothetical protein
MDDSPVSLAGLVVGTTLAVQQFRRLGEHTARNGRCRLPMQSMTYRAVVFVELGSGKVIRLVDRIGTDFGISRSKTACRAFLARYFSSGIGGVSSRLARLPDKK